MRIRPQVFSKIEESPWTYNWHHLVPISHSYLSRLKKQNNTLPIRPKDRIKQWNIVPGDRVRVRGEEAGSIRQVFGINRYNNFVYLKGLHVRAIHDFSCSFCRFLTLPI